MTALTDKQEAFAVHFVTYRSPTEAYVHAYNVRPETTDATIRGNSSNLMRHPAIKLRIRELDASRVSQAMKPLAEIIDEIDQMAALDYNELSAEGVGSCRHCWSEGHAYHWKEREFGEAVADWERLAAKDPSVIMPDCSGGFGYRKTRPPNEACPECEGVGLPYVRYIDTAKLSPAARMAYQGVKITKQGREILFIGKEKLKDWQVRLRGGFKDGLDVKFPGPIEVDLSGKSPADAAKVYAEMLGVKKGS